MFPTAKREKLISVRHTTEAACILFTSPEMAFAKQNVLFTFYVMFWQQIVRLDFIFKLMHSLVVKYYGSKHKVAMKIELRLA